MKNVNAKPVSEEFIETLNTINNYLINNKDKLVKEYVRLPYENVYEDDDEWGKICLFPKAKYELFF